jgi:hypothetical protein
VLVCLFSCTRCCTRGLNSPGDTWCVLHPAYLGPALATKAFTLHHGFEFQRLAVRMKTHSPYVRGSYTAHCTLVPSFAFVDKLH